MIYNEIKNGDKMKDGFIKVGACSPDIEVADTKKNAETIIKYVKEADGFGVKLLCFPELCITGYTCGDLFLTDTLLENAWSSLIHIKQQTKNTDVVFIVGLPLRLRGRVHDCAAVLHGGEVIGLMPKSKPTTAEMRWFASGEPENDFKIINDEYCGVFNLVFSCENLPDFTFSVSFGSQESLPSEYSGANITAVLAASSEIIGRADFRRELVRSNSRKNICGYIYADAAPTESTQDGVYSSHCLIAENGKILAENKPFGDNRLLITEIDVSYIMHEKSKNNDLFKKTDTGYSFKLKNITETTLTRKIEKNPFVPDDEAELASRAEEIFEMQSYGLKKRLEVTRCKPVIGLSGGLDSTLALLVCCKTYDLMGENRKDILTYTMPCFGTTNRTKSNAQKLAELCGVSFEEINISASVTQHLKDIGIAENDRGTAYENAQARERTQVLMDIANQKGGLVIGTGDLSELALGWCTYNGDHMSMYGVNASIPKSLVRWLVRYEASNALKNGNKDYAAVLFDVLETPVSPELLPPDKDSIVQKTEEIVGPYELHDFFIYNFVRRGYSPSKILRLAQYAYGGKYDKETILKWEKVFFRKFFTQQFKRSCVPGGAAVGSVSFSPRTSLMMPDDASSALWLKELEGLKV